MEQEQEVSTQINDQVTTADTGNGTQSYEAPRAQEKLIPQSEVDRIVGTRIASVAEKTRAKVMAEFQNQQPHQSMSNGAYAPGNQQNIDDLVNSKVDSKLSELQRQYNQQQQEAYYNDISSKFAGRMDAVKDTYPDFDAVVGDFPFASYPNAVLSSMNFDNTGHIMYELASNPLKMEAVDSFARKDADNAQRGIKSNLAQRELSKISQALKVNESAKSEKNANSPLTHIKSSPTSADSGDRSVSDFRAYWKSKGR